MLAFLIIVALAFGLYFIAKAVDTKFINKKKQPK